MSDSDYELDSAEETSEFEDLDEPEQINVPYYEDYRRHVQDLRLHLLGQDAKDSPYEELESSFIEALNYWTSEDKQAFFHGLARFSRLRPDLIAALVKTKNIVDVCIYLDVLEQAAVAQEGREDRNPEEERGGGEVQAAAEMTAQWITFEERSARVLGHIEQEQQREAPGEDDIDLATAGKKFSDRELEAMENILRESEDNCADLDAIPDDLQATGKGGHSTKARPEPRASSPSSAQVAANPSSSTSALDTSKGASVSPGLPSPEPMAMHSDEDEGASGPGENEDVNSLSPASRRRLQKRLYMRRKRAMKDGRDHDSVSVKLRPGRKIKPRKPSKPRPTTYKQRERRPGRPSAKPKPEAHTDDNFARPHTSGRTAFYKAKRELLDSGIDAEAMKDEGLGLFHLSAVARLMHVFISGYGGSGYRGQQPSISADVIRLLTGITVEFITEVIHRAVVIGEQENIVKGKSKVWKKADEQITVEGVKLVLEIMGMKVINKEDYFAKLLSEHLGEDSNATNDPTQDAATPPKDDPEPSGFPTGPSIHHELYQGQVYLPPSYSLMSREDEMKEANIPEGEDEGESDKELERELHEDEDMNQRDLAESRIYEETLWEMVL